MEKKHKSDVNSTDIQSSESTVQTPFQTGANSREIQLSLRGSIRFEFSSLVGRKLFSRCPPIVSGGPQLLNLGCGANRYDEFVNADFFTFKSGFFLKHFWMLDLRYKLKVSDNYWDGVYSEHTLEHLYPKQVESLLLELHRTLKPGAWLRIIVPDLAKYVNYYNGEESHPLFHRWHYRAQAMRNISQNHFHYSLWDAPLLTLFLKNAGFAIVLKKSFGQGSDSRLLKDSANREWESLYIEARK
jgi:predicted SAM-dependent methyltransferase